MFNPSIEVAQGVFSVVFALLTSVIAAAVYLHRGRKAGLPLTTESTGKSLADGYFEGLMEAISGVYNSSAWRTQTNARNSGILVGAVAGLVVGYIISRVAPAAADGVYKLVALGVLVVSLIALYKVGRRICAGYLPTIALLSNLDWRGLASQVYQQQPGDQHSAPLAAVPQPLADGDGSNGGTDESVSSGTEALRDGTNGGAQPGNGAGSGGGPGAGGVTGNG